MRLRVFARTRLFSALAVVGATLTMSPATAQSSTAHGVPEEQREAYTCAKREMRSFSWVKSSMQANHYAKSYARFVTADHFMPGEEEASLERLLTLLISLGDGQGGVDAQGNHLMPHKLTALFAYALVKCFEAHSDAPSSQPSSEAGGIFISFDSCRNEYGTHGSFTLTNNTEHYINDPWFTAEVFDQEGYIITAFDLTFGRVKPGQSVQSAQEINYEGSCADYSEMKVAPNELVFQIDGEAFINFEYELQEQLVNSIKVVDNRKP